MKILHRKRITPLQNSLEQSMLNGVQHVGRALFLLVVLGPLVAIPLDPTRTAVSSREVLRLLFPQGRRLTLLFRSLGLGAAVGLTAMMIGTLIVLKLWEWRRPPLSFLRWACLALVAIPPYIHALAWSEVMASSLGEATASRNIGWVMSWWVQTMAFLPLATGLALLGIEALDPKLIAIGRVYRSDKICLRRLILPLAAPHLGAGAGLIFTLSILDYSIPSLFQLNTYSLDIFAEYSATASPLRALLISLPLLLVCLIIILLAQAPLRQAAAQSGWRLPTWQTPPHWPQWLSLLQIMALAIAMMQALIPLLALLSATQSATNFFTTVAQAHKEIAFTIKVSSAAAILAFPLALPVAHCLAIRRRSAAWWWPLAMFNLAIPPPLVGVGLISQWRQLAPNIVYGTWLMPMLVALNRYTPWAVLLIQAHLCRVDRSLFEAGQVFQPNRWLGWLYIRLPILSPALLSAAALTMALGAGELGGTLLVAPPGRATLAMRVYNYLHYGASEAVAGLCLALLLGTITAGLCASFALNWWARRNAQEVGK